MSNFISTLCPALDDLLGGGVEKRTINQIYGDFATGKTALCIQTAKKVLLDGKKVIYIDTESGLSIIRIKQILENKFENLKNNLIILEPTNFESQHNDIINLKKIVDENFELIIVDSLASLYRLESTNQEERVLMSRELGKQLAILTGVAKNKNLGVLITNQVYENIDKKILEPIGGSIIKYWSKNIIELSKSKDSKRRVAKLIRHRFLPPNIEAEFEITNRGIEEIR